MPLIIAVRNTFMSIGVKVDENVRLIPGNANSMWTESGIKGTNGNKNR
jgi:hypothetical protein